MWKKMCSYEKSDDRKYIRTEKWKVKNMEFLQVDWRHNPRTIVKDRSNGFIAENKSQNYKLNGWFVMWSRIFTWFEQMFTLVSSQMRSELCIYALRASPFQIGFLRDGWWSISGDEKVMDLLASARDDWLSDKCEQIWWTLVPTIWYMPFCRCD